MKLNALFEGFSKQIYKTESDSSDMDSKLSAEQTINATDTPVDFYKFMSLIKKQLLNCDKINHDPFEKSFFINHDPFEKSFFDSDRYVEFRSFCFILKTSDSSFGEITFMKDYSNNAGLRILFTFDGYEHSHNDFYDFIVRQCGANKTESTSKDILSYIPHLTKSLSYRLSDILIDFITHKKFAF